MGEGGGGVGAIGNGGEGFMRQTCRKTGFYCFSRWRFSRLGGGIRRRSYVGLILAEPWFCTKNKYIEASLDLFRFSTASSFFFYLPFIISLFLRYKRFFFLSFFLGGGKDRFKGVER